MRTFIITILICLYSWLACSSTGSVRRQIEEPSARRQPGDQRALKVITGEASYYGAEFHGRKTSSGEIYDMYALTAAHPHLPFGTICKVTNLSNNKNVIVKINDRGPFIKNRIIDLSYAAAQEIDGITSGIMEVTVEVITYGAEESNN